MHFWLATLGKGLDVVSSDAALRWQTLAVFRNKALVITKLFVGYHIICLIFVGVGVLG